MLIMCFPVYLDFGHGQLENEVAKVLFTTVFFFFIPKGTPTTGWLYLAMSIQWCACLVPSTILSKFGSILV